MSLGKFLLVILLIALASSFVAPSILGAYDHSEMITNSTVKQYKRQLNVTGPQKTILVLVEFRNTTHTKFLEDIDRTMSLVDKYWQEVSYGKISIGWSIVGWYLMDRTLAYYGADIGGEGNDTNAVQLLHDAVKAADNDVDYRNFNHVVVVHAGMDQTISNITSDLWPHHWVGLKISTNDGILVDHALYVSEFGGLGAYVHEFAHSLGLPDLYPRDKKNPHLVSNWSLMDSGSWLGEPKQSSPSGLEAWSLTKLGWISTVEVNPTAEGTVMTLYPLEKDYGTRVLKITTSEDDYYLVELRMKIGVDTALPYSAVLISFINESARTAYHDGYGAVNIIGKIPTDSKKYTYKDVQHSVFIQLKSCNATSCELTIASRALIAYHNIPSSVWTLLPTEIVLRFKNASGIAIPNLRVAVHIDESIQYIETDTSGEARFNLFFITPGEHMVHVEPSGIIVNEVTVTVQSDATWLIVPALIVVSLFLLVRVMKRSRVGEDVG